MGNVIIEDNLVQRSAIGKQTLHSNIQKTPACRNCGAELSPDSKFCHLCGEKITCIPSTPIFPNKPEEAQSKTNINKLKVRNYLIDSAAEKQTVTYKEFKDYFELPYMIQAFNHLKQISNDCIQKGEPLLSAIVVNEDGLPGEGFWDSGTRQYLNYQGSTKDAETRKVHQRELEKVLSYNWK